MAVELSVGEVAERAGVAVSALHFYERKGLIRSHRTGGNQRRYDRDVLRRLAIIRMGQELGVPLAEIGEQLLECPGIHHRPGQAVLAQASGLFENRDVDFPEGGIRLGARGGDGHAVDRDAALRDEFLGRPARGDTRRRQDLLEA